jgi:hypothetical protein
MIMTDVPTIIPVIMKPHEASRYPTSRVAPQYTSRQLPLGLAPSAMKRVKPTNIVSSQASNEAKPKKEKSSKGGGFFSKGRTKQKLLVTQKQASCPTIMMNPNPTPSGSSASRRMRSQSLHGNVAANCVTVNNILQQQQQQQQQHQQSWKGAPAPVPIQSQPMRQQQLYQPVTTTIHQGSPPHQFNRPQAHHVAPSSSQVQGQESLFRNKNNPFGGRSDSINNVNAAVAPGARSPQERGRPGSEHVQMAASTATSQAGNTSMLRMNQNRRSIQSGVPGPGPGDARVQQSSQIIPHRRPQGGGHVRTSSAPIPATIQPDVSGRGQAAPIYGHHHSDRMVGGQQLAHVTPTIQQMASHGASFRAAQQAQMFSDSRPPANQPRNVQGQMPMQMQMQGPGQQSVKYERGSFKNGMERRYLGQFAAHQRSLSAEFYSNQQQDQNGQHLSSLGLGKR